MPPPDNAYGKRFLTRLTSTGALDTTFTSIGPVPHIDILTGLTDMDACTLINILQDGKILVSGDFTQVEDGSLTPPQRQWIARFTANGLLDNTFTSPYSDWIPPEYLATAVQSNNRILIGGGQMARLYPDGSWDEAFEQGRGLVWGGTVKSIVPVPGGKSLIGGSFTSYGGVSRPGIARIMTPDGSADPAIYLLLLN